MKQFMIFLTAIIIIATQAMAQPTPQDTSDIVWMKKLFPGEEVTYVINITI